MSGPTAGPGGLFPSSLFPLFRSSPRLSRRPSPRPRRPLPRSLAPRSASCSRAAAPAASPHIGVLKVLHEMHIPIDYIAGTSMGAIVGGLYASGMTPQEMQRQLGAVNWPTLLEDEPPRRDVAFRRKEEEAAFPMGFEIGYRNGEFLWFRGALSGSNLELYLHELHAPGRRRGELRQAADPLPGVATNMVTGKEVVFDKGFLYHALRASMSVPGMFAPVELDGQILGDGGLVNNLPVDVVRAMGADIVIAVNIGTPLMSRDQLQSVVGYASQMLNILTEQNVRAQLALAEAGRHPDLAGPREPHVPRFRRGAEVRAAGRRGGGGLRASSWPRCRTRSRAVCAVREAIHRPAAEAAGDARFRDGRRHAVRKPRGARGTDADPRGRAVQHEGARRRPGADVRARRPPADRLRAGPRRTAAGSDRERGREGVGSRLPALRPLAVVRPAGRDVLQRDGRPQARLGQQPGRRMDERGHPRQHAALRDRVLPAAHAVATSCSRPRTASRSVHPSTSSTAKRARPSTTC